MKRFRQLVIEHLKIPEESIQESLTPKDVPDWDSMNYLLFIAELEKEYGVTFTMDEVLRMGSLGEVANALRSKGIAL